MHVRSVSGALVDSLKGQDTMPTKKKAAKNKNIRIPVESLDKSLADKSFKIAKKDYEKYYKLGMKYAREFNKMAIAKRKELVHNDDEAFGWTDGFVEGALVTLYDALDVEEYRERYHTDWCKNL